MTHDDRFEAAVRGWLRAAAPPEAPDRILDAVDARIDALDQVHRSRWPSVLAAAVVLVAVLSAGLWFAGPRIGAPEPIPPDPTEAWTKIGCAAAGCEFAMAEGGRYQSSTFGVVARVRPPSDRWVVDADQAGYLRIEIRTDARQGITLLTDPVPTDAMGNALDIVATDPASFAAWLASRDQLNVSSPAAATLGGLSGLVVDLEGDPDPVTQAQGCPHEGLCAAAFGYSPTPGEDAIYGTTSLDRIRLYLLDAGEHLLVVAVEARHLAPPDFVDGEGARLVDDLELAAAP